VIISGNLPTFLERSGKLLKRIFLNMLVYQWFTVSDRFTPYPVRGPGDTTENLSRSNSVEVFSLSGIFFQSKKDRKFPALVF
jgi:hypothetical protein